jgi:TRAP-type C4-dicarboxylate transport system permease small subunit
MKLEKLINSAIPIVCAGLFIGVILVTFLQIVVRQFFNISLNWSDEVAQILLTWDVLLGLIWVTKDNQHITTQINLHHKLNGRLVSLIDCVIELVIAIVTAVIAYRSARFCFMSMRSSIVSLSWLKLGYIYVMMPLSMLAMSYYYFKNFSQKIRLFLNK